MIKKLYYKMVNKDLNREEYDELILNYNFAKNSIRSFARKYDIHYNTVARYMDELGILRPKQYHKQQKKIIIIPPPSSPQKKSKQKSDKKVIKKLQLTEDPLEVFRRCLKV